MLLDRAGDGSGRCSPRPARGRPDACLPCVVVAAVLATPAPLAAGEWRFSSGALLRETYSDNVNLAPEGEEEGELVTDVNPGFSLRGQGARLSANLDYNLQAIFPAGDSVSRSLNHQLQADSSAELLERIVFVDVRSTVSQVNQTNTGRDSRSNITGAGDSTDAITYSVSPYVVHRFGSYADSLVRYTFDGVINEGDAEDSTSTGVSANLTSGRRFSRMPWSVDASRRTIDNERSQDTDFQRVAGTLSYVFNRQWRVTGSAGREFNDFASSQDEQDGPFWRVSTTWTPSVRTTVEAGYADRFFGSNVFFDVEHRSRRTVWHASFAEDTSTTRDVQLQRQLIPLTDEFGEPILDPEIGQPVLVPLDLETLSSEVIVRQRFSGGMAVRWRRTRLSVNGFHEQRDFQVTGDNETVVGASVAWSRDLRRHLSLRIDGGWQATEFRGGGDETVWDAGAALSYRLGAQLSGTASYQYLKQESGDAGSEFDENRFILALRMTF